MRLSKMLFRGTTICLIALLCACSFSRLPDDKTVPVEKPDATVVVPPATAPAPGTTGPSASAAWQPLLKKAEQATSRGDYEQALALLERAQRIDPDSAEVYLGLAKTHKARGDVVQSRATAQRGLLYCSTTWQCEALRVYTR